MKKVLFISLLSGRPDFYPFYTELAETGREAGFELSGISFGMERPDDIGFPVEYLPAPTCMSYTHLLGGVSFKGKEKKKAVEPFLRLAEFEPKHVEKHGLKSVAAILMNLHIYMRDYLVRNKIHCVILGHQFAAPHQVVRNVCVELGVNVLYNHPGVLHGTTCFETQGQMAESSLFQHWPEITSNPLSSSDIELADRYLEKLRSGVLKRPGKMMPSEDMAVNFAKYLKYLGKKIILYAGMVDFRTGVCPESYEGSKKHSPWARSNHEGLQAVVDATEDSGEIVIYKPHPLWAMNASDILKSDRVFTISNISIADLLEFSDVLVTVCSSSSYESLAENIPTVLLGEMQASLCESVYQVKKREDLPEVLKEAVNRGELSGEAFREHVAYLLRDYLLRADGAIEELPMKSCRDFWEGMRDSPPQDLVIESTGLPLSPFSVGYSLKGVVMWGKTRLKYILKRKCSGVIIRQMFKDLRLCALFLRSQSK